jgi:hypothetical protein
MRSLEVSDGKICNAENQTRQLGRHRPLLRDEKEPTHDNGKAVVPQI